MKSSTVACQRCGKAYRRLRNCNPTQGIDCDASIHLDGDGK
jgi:hypothetical protein